LIRATRSTAARATFLPVSTEPVKAMQSIPSCGQQVDGSGRQRREALGEHQGRERRQLRRLADGGVARGQGRPELPAEQQQRVVPRDDAADHAERLLEHERKLRGLDRRDHPSGRVASDLGVVVEAGRGPADLVRVLDQGLAAFAGHHLGQLVGSRAQAGGDLVQHLAALYRGRAAPAGGRLAGRGHRRLELFGARLTQLGDRLLRVGILDRERLAVARHLLAADQQSRLHRTHPSDGTHSGSLVLRMADCARPT
jgi:hypothetical protein